LAAAEQSIAGTHDILNVSLDDGVVKLPYTLRLEFAKGPKTTDRLSMKISKCLNRQSPELAQVITRLSQAERHRLDAWASEIERGWQQTFPAVARVLVQSRALLVVPYNADAYDHKRTVRTSVTRELLDVIDLPTWCEITSRQVVQELRAKLQSVFHMQLEEI
jgi:hypothetical protein